jgi:hypothetical protein
MKTFERERIKTGLWLLLFCLAGFLCVAAISRGTNVYSENFSAYAVNTTLWSNPPDYVASAGGPSVQNGLGGKYGQVGASGATIGVYYDGASYTYTDLTMTCMDAGGVGSWIFVTARWNDGFGSGTGNPYNGYTLAYPGCNTYPTYLYRFDAGTATILGFGANLAVTPSNFNARLFCHGNQIEVWLDGVQIIAPVTDATYASGKIGFGASYWAANGASNITVDDGASVFCPTPTPTPTPIYSPTPTPTPTNSRGLYLNRQLRLGP